MGARIRGARMLILQNHVVEETLAERNKVVAAGWRVPLHDALVSHQARAPQMPVDLRIAAIRVPPPSIAAFCAASGRHSECDHYHGHGNGCPLERVRNHSSFDP